jgi:DNA-binding Xre family transcriptional regulator
MPAKPFTKQYQALGRSMRELRLQAGMSQGEMARKIGISQSQLSRLEDSQEGVRFVVLLKISKVLGCKPSEILKEAGL